MMNSFRFAIIAGVLLCIAVGAPASPPESAHQWFAIDGTPAFAGNPVGEDGLIRTVSSSVLGVTRAAGTSAPEGTVLLFPGGGYHLLDVRNEGANTAKMLNGFGYDVAMLEYHVNAGAKTRELALDDAVAAWRVLTKNPQKLGVHIRRLVIMGYSAGGHLAARLVERLAATGGRPPDDVVLVSPAYLDEHALGANTALVEPPPRPHARLIAFLAANDRPEWVNGCKRYVRQWQESGGYAVLHALKDGAHGFGMRPDLTGEAEQWPEELQYLLENGPKPGVGPFNTFLPWHLGNVRDRLSTFTAEAAMDRGAVVFLGDSITRKWDLAAAFRPVHVANRGISGDTTRGMLCRLQETVLNLRPKAIVFMGGINDLTQSPVGTPGTIAANVRSILAQIAVAQPNTPVFVCETLPSKSAPLETVRQVNAAVDAVVANFPNARRVRTFAAFLNSDGTENQSLFVDGTHPNAAGYAIWRKLLEPEVSSISAQMDPKGSLSHARRRLE